MKANAVRLYGKNDLRLESFELPAIKENEILAKVVCDSLCMSSYKAAPAPMARSATEPKRYASVFHDDWKAQTKPTATDK